MKSLKYTLPVLASAGFLLFSQGTVQAFFSPSEKDSPNTTTSIQSYVGGATPQIVVTDRPQSAKTSTMNEVAATGSLMTNDPFFDREWPLQKIRMPDLAQLEQKTNSPVLVAILDTGIDKDHEDLQGKVVAEVNFTDSPTADDLNGHGTFVAGIISANIDNGIGIAGMAPQSRLLNVKVADDQGRCKGTTVAQGIVWAADNGAKVINISLELNLGFPELASAVNYAWQKGAVVVAAASNDTIDPVFPAYYTNSIAVAATAKNDQEGPLSDYGKWVDVLAPGMTVYSTLPNNKYGFESGTSFAVAHVSGLAALLYSAAQDSNAGGALNAEVRAAIQKGAIKIGSNGIGTIDVANSLALINTAAP